MNWTNLIYRSNPIIKQELFTGDAAGLAASNFDPAKPTKIFAHGWTENGYNDPVTLSIRDGINAHFVIRVKNN